MVNFKLDPQFGARFPQAGGVCAQSEAMLADALDGSLTAEEQAQFDLHVSTCATCAQMLAGAQRGAAWLEMLRTPRPEPPAALLERILSQTMAQTTAHMAAQAVGQGPVAAVNLSVSSTAGYEAQNDTPPRMATVLPFRSRVAAAFHRNALGHAMLQPRLAMTAAMAFFSIGLTLNLTGVRLNELRVSNLKPANLRRSFYEADAHLVRYYTNLRVVYELESRVRDLQRATENEAPGTAEPEAKPQDDPKGTPGQQKARPQPGAGTSRRQRQSNIRELQTVAALRSAPSIFNHSTIAQEGELV